MLFCFPAYIITGNCRTVKKRFSVIGEYIFKIVCKIIERDFYFSMMGFIFISNQFCQRGFIVFSIKRNRKGFKLLLYLLAMAVANPLSIPPLKKHPTSKSEESILRLTAILKILSTLSGFVQNYHH